MLLSTSSMYVSFNMMHRNVMNFTKVSLSHLSTATTLLSFHILYKGAWPDDLKHVKGRSQYNFLAVLYMNISTDTKQFDTCCL